MHARGRTANTNFITI